MKGMILAAGLGTRLRPLTWTMPKPMVPLCNRPLVAWAVESYLAAGIDDLIVNLHHLPDAIESYLDAEVRHRATIAFSREQEILGTGGALRRVRDALEPAGGFFLVNGDTVQFPRYRELGAAREHHRAVAALTLRHPPANDRFTAVWFEAGRVTGFGEGTGEPLMFAGSHAISSDVFRHFPDRDVFGIVDAVYQPLLAAGIPLAGVVDDGLWFDIGTPRRYLGASAALLAAMTSGSLSCPPGSRLAGDSLTGEHSTIRGTLSRSTVGARSSVEGAVSDSIVWDAVRVGEGVRLERCIVASGVELTGSGLQFADRVICLDHPAIPPDLPRHDGLVIAPA